MTKLSEYSKGKVHAALYSAVCQVGSYEVDKVLPPIEEQLNGPETDACTAFLKWLVANGREFGHNLPEVWKEWEGAE